MTFSELLINSGFKYTESSVTGVIKNCYEKFIPLSNLYDGWIAVEPKSGNVSIYVEYECGGSVVNYDNLNVYEFNSEAKNDPQEAYKEVEDLIDIYMNGYKKEENLS